MRPFLLGSTGQRKLAACRRDGRAGRAAPLPAGACPPGGGPAVSRGNRAEAQGFCLFPRAARLVPVIGAGRAMSVGEAGALAGTSPQRGHDGPGVRSCCLCCTALGSGPGEPDARLDARCGRAPWRRPIPWRGLLGLELGLALALHPCASTGSFCRRPWLGPCWRATVAPVVPVHGLAPGCLVGWRWWPCAGAWRPGEPGVPRASAWTMWSIAAVGRGGWRPWRAPGRHPVVHGGLWQLRQSSAKCVQWAMLVCEKEAPWLRRRGRR